MTPQWTYLTACLEIRTKIFEWGFCNNLNLWPSNDASTCTHEQNQNPWIHRFYYKFKSLLTMALEKESCCMDFHCLRIITVPRKEGVMSFQALNTLTGCSSHTDVGRSHCTKYTSGLWRNPWSSYETQTSCCHGTSGTGWRRSPRRSGTSGDAVPSKTDRQVHLNNKYKQDWLPLKNLPINKITPGRHNMKHTDIWHK